MKIVQRAQALACKAPPGACGLVVVLAALLAAPAAATPREPGGVEAPARRPDSFDPAAAGIPLSEADELRIHQGLAQALVAERAWARALVHIAWLRERLPLHWTVQLEYAQAVYFVHADAPRALEALQKALLLKPVNPRAVLLMGQIYEDQGETRKAEHAYRQVLEWRPDEDQAALNLARLLRRQDALDEARALLEGLVSRQATHLVALTELAMIAERQGRLQDAEALYRKLLAVHPDAFSGHAQLIGFFRRTQQTRKASEVQRALERLVERDGEPRGGRGPR